MSDMVTCTSPGCNNGWKQTRNPAVDDRGRPAILVVLVVCQDCMGKGKVPA